MNPTELRTLFSSKEQTLLVATEAARLSELSEDELDELLTRVRRARNKYTKLYRRQSSALVDASSSRAGTSTSNQRTKRKAEIFEDTLSRVARALSTAARATANELKRERLETARVAKTAKRTGSAGRPANRGGRRSSDPDADQWHDPAESMKGGRSTDARRASSKAQNARRQSRRDSR